MTNFFIGLALGFLISYILTLYFDKPEVTVNGKNSAKKGGVIDFGVDFSKLKKRKLFNIFKRRNKK